MVTQSAAEGLLLGICRYTLSEISLPSKLRKTYESVRVVANALDARSSSDTDGIEISWPFLQSLAQSPDLHLQRVPVPALSAAAKSTSTDWPGIANTTMMTLAYSTKQ